MCFALHFVWLIKLKSAMGGDFGAKAAEMGKLFSYAARSEVTDLSFDDLKLSCDSTDTFDIKPTPDQVRGYCSFILVTAIHPLTMPEICQSVNLNISIYT